MVGPLGPGPSRPQIALIFYLISLKHIRRLNCLSLLNAEKCGHSKAALYFSQTGLMTSANSLEPPARSVGDAHGRTSVCGWRRCGECIGLVRSAAS